MFTLYWKSGNTERFETFVDLEMRLMRMTLRGLDYIARIERA